MSKPQQNQRRQNCILVPCVVLTVPSHNQSTNGGKTTLLRDGGDRRVHNATITMRHTEVTVTVTQPGQSECTLILTLTIPLTPNQRQKDD